jgi:hypothetical protein
VTLLQLVFFVLGKVVSLICRTSRTLVGTDSYKQNVPCIVHNRTAGAGC